MGQVGGIMQMFILILTILISPYLAYEYKKKISSNLITLKNPESIQDIELKSQKITNNWIQIIQDRKSESMNFENKVDEFNDNPKFN